MTITEYGDFLATKFKFSKAFGFEIERAEIHPLLHRHQPDIVQWAVRKGRCALFEKFGLGKTFQQLEILRLLNERDPGRYLIIAPLGVRTEFAKDAVKLGIEYKFVRRTEELDGAGIYLTNYESVRDGKLDIALFRGVSLDEASVLRSYGSKTYQEFLELFADTPYRFVATATPSPNRYKELIHYAGFLGVMDTGQALTRFFQRDSTQANNLTLYPHMEAEFHLWLHSWAVFIQRPSDLGHSDEGYELPPIDVRWHEVQPVEYGGKVDRDGQIQLINNAAVSLPDAAEEKRKSIDVRVAKAVEILDEADSLETFILWHDLEDERHAIQVAVPDVSSVYGTQDLDEREQVISDFSEGLLAVLSTKPELAGSGCNFQRHCHRAIFIGITYKFNDFIQSCFRLQRFQQTQPVRIDIIYTENERGIRQELLRKWDEYETLCFKMSALLRKYGLATEGLEMELRRTIGVERTVEAGEMFEVVLNDVILELMPSHADQGREGSLRPRVPGEKYRDTPSTEPGMVPTEPLDMYPQSSELESETSREARRFEEEVPRGESGTSSTKDAGMVSEEQGGIPRTGTRRRSSEEIRHQSGRFPGNVGSAKGEVRDLQGDVLPENSTSRSLPQNREDAGDSLLSVQYGPGPISGRSEVAKSRDSVSQQAPWKPWEDNCVDLILTSIPFGNHYEYSPSYNDLGHNEDNEAFFRQMDFLTPNLLRILRPGRVAAIHVKDRIRFGNVTGYGMPTVDPFHCDCVAHYRKHGFAYMGMITVVTDVVRENNQTYRLGWSEQCKDGTKMGVGSPEYILLFRKLPTDRSKAYADVRVEKSKEDYTRARWQVDAHSFWRSSGRRLLTSEELEQLTPEAIGRVFLQHSLETVYDHDQHIAIGEALDSRGALPATFMTLAPGSHHPDVWHDVNRMLTLNGAQTQRGLANHICPLQFDIVDRIIRRYTNEGEIVFDPFGGLFTVPFRAIKLRRRGKACELNPEYFRDGLRYLRAAEIEASIPTLFDLLEQEATA